MKQCPILFVAALATVTCGQVHTYEGDIAPEKAGWEVRLAGTFGAERLIEDGALVQMVELPEGWSGPLGNAEFYRRAVAEFSDTTAFFIEWRAETDATSFILDVQGTPAVLSAAGDGNANYHLTFTDQRVRVIRHSTLPVVYVDIAPGVAYMYRVELFSDMLYRWYVDGQEIDSGIPYGEYPRKHSRIIWGSRFYLRDLPVQTTRWDYIRYGVIPIDGSGDFDSDEAITEHDFYFFHDCLTKDGPGINGGPGNNSGPGCRFADFDADGDTDLRDLSHFQNTFTESS